MKMIIWCTELFLKKVGSEILLSDGARWITMHVNHNYTTANVQIINNNLIKLSSNKNTYLPDINY